MNCHLHPDREAVQRCERCGRVICQECSLIFDGRSICKSCVSRAIDSEPARAERVRYPHARSHNLLIVFLLSCLPGAAHMYMGLMKRGMMILISFFLSIWMAAELNGAPFFGILIAAICIVSFFDGLNVRKRIVTGEYVEDTVADVAGAVKRFKLPIKIIVLYVLISSLFGAGLFRYGGFFPSGVFYNAVNLGNIIKIMIVGFIFYALFNPGGRKAKKKYDEPIDKRNADGEQD